ncbi:MAG: SufS family cysteine desulfurase [Candidatus Pacebacteria bacterium]|nr:SufS family cysteine desulfurase [Candidatus Paceibacterota bacterium]
MPDSLNPSAKSEGQSRKSDFPIFANNPRDLPLIYLDSGASTQKPQAVIDATSHFYAHDYANIHRGVYRLSQVATHAYEIGRETVARFIHSPSPDSIVFTRGATESFNLLADCLGRSGLIKAGDRIVLTEVEHHANIIPWQMLRDRLGLQLAVVPLMDSGALDLDEFERLLQPPTRLVSFTHISNVTGLVNPVARMVAAAAARGVMTVIDGCQAVAHRPVNVEQLGCDFYIFSGHKLYGPTGTGVLYGRGDLLGKLPPYQTGGDMITTVTFAETRFQPPPQRFEAGTPNIAGVVGLTAAIGYVESLGFDWIVAHEKQLLELGLKRLQTIDRVKIIPVSGDRSGAISFTLEGIHPHDIATVLDDHSNVAVRAGHHCAQPLMQRLGLAATIRASLGVYNDRDCIEALAMGLEQVNRIFK